VICKVLPWDSSHFGLRIARVETNRLDPSVLAEIDVWLNANPVDCLYFLAAPESETLKLAAKAGFRFVDARVTLDYVLPKNARAESSGYVRTATREDLPELQRIASESHHDSRFYVDGNFARPACDELYRIWISKGLENKEGRVFVAEQDSKLVGYNSIYQSEGEGTISLIAIDSRYRGQGLATHLMNRAEQWFREQNVERVTVPTQAANIPALRLYESRGFKITKVEPWFHRWL